MTDEVHDGGDLRSFPIQLTDVFCVELSAERRDRHADDPDELSLDVSVSSTGLSEDRLHFSSRLEASAIAPVLEDQAAATSVIVQGDFAASEPVAEEIFQEFLNYTPLVLLWPYARSYLGSLGAALGVTLPPLPLIDALEPVEATEPSE